MMFNVFVTSPFLRDDLDLLYTKLERACLAAKPDQKEISRLHRCIKKAKQRYLFDWTQWFNWMLIGAAAFFSWLAWLTLFH